MPLSSLDRVWRLGTLAALVAACACGGTGDGTGGGSGTGGGNSGTGGGSSGTGGGSSGTGGGFTSGSVTVTGTVTYDFVPSVYVPGQGGGLDFANAVQKPVRGAVVWVLQGSATTPIGISATNDQGQYSVSFTPGATGTLTLYALSRTSSPAIQVQDNTQGNSTYAISTSLTGSSQTGVNLRATHGWTGTAFDATRRGAAPFAILDSMQTAIRAFVAARPSLVFPALKCNWSSSNAPSAGDPTTGAIGTSHFSPSNNQLYILGKDGVDTDEFDTHVIVHEWGHFFEFNLSRSDSPGGQHSAGNILDPRLAFGEAWGNAVASMVLPETVYSDTSWGTSGMGSFGFDAETEPGSPGNVTDDPTPGFWSESSVMRFLYDVYDNSGGAESFDTVALGLAPIVNAMVGAEKTTVALTTVASFVTALKAAGAPSPAMNTLLAHYKIGAITDEWGTGDVDLRSTYKDVSSLPFTTSYNLGALGTASKSNTWYQNEYFVFTATAASTTVSAGSADHDVGIKAYQAGRVVGAADQFLTGTETLTLTTTPGLKYVVVLTGYSDTLSGEYPVTVSIQ